MSLETFPFETFTGLSARQVGTTDGRLKLIGRRGVEVLLVGDDASGTRQLLFLSGKGALARVTEVSAPRQLAGCLTSHRYHNVRAWQVQQPAT